MQISIIIIIVKFKGFPENGKRDVLKLAKLPIFIVRLLMTRCEMMVDDDVT